MLALVSGCQCSPELPQRPVECDENGVGCLIDEVCVQGLCSKLEPCDRDDDCPLMGQACVFPSRICEFRPGFSDECVEDTDCDAGSFCALGKCRVAAESRPCARRTDCVIGQTCDQDHFFCIEEGPCTLADDYPELACEADEVCDNFSERCTLSCQFECTPETELDDCGVGNRCDGACRCVQCLNDDDCGLGLVCNVRAGRCQSDDLCFNDDDCEEPLFCEPRTSLCQVRPPPCESDLDCDLAEFCDRNTGVCELPTGPCIDDRFEDADTPVTAEELNVANGESRLFDELQLCPEDDDVYAIALDAGDNLVVRIDQTSKLARPTVWLLDPEGELSLRFAEAPPFGDGTISYVAEQSELIYIRVNALLGASPYEMEVSRNTGIPCSDDAFEGESGNDSFAAPSEGVPPSIELAASLCQDDTDHYAIDLESNEALRANLVFDDPNADFDLAIVDSASGAVLSQSSGLSGRESVFLRTPFARRVILRVSSFNRATGDYRFNYEVLAPFVCEDDAFEPDNLLEGARVLGIDEVIDEERTLCTGDNDVIAVPMLDFQRVVARAEFDAAEFDLEFRVTNAAGEVLDTSPNSADGETLSYSSPRNETVYVNAIARNNSEGAYRYTLIRENQVDCALDPLEPNNSNERASSLRGPRADLTLCGDDEDLFVFFGNQGQRLNVSLAFNHGDGDIDLMLLGTDGQQILAISDSRANTESASVVLPIDGIYYARVFSLNESPRNRYSIDASVE